MASLKKDDPTSIRNRDEWSHIRILCELKEAGLPAEDVMYVSGKVADGWRLVKRDDGLKVAVRYAANTPEDQMARGDAVVKASDLRQRGKRTRPDVADQIVNWINGDIGRLAAVASLALADVLYDQPLYARRNGVPIDGAELSPK